MASEEDEHIIEVTQTNEDAHYFVAFDPLDGSSNIDANISIGTIWCIFRRQSDHSETI
jgi:fructose-1,6-bisphosphatase I